MAKKPCMHGLLKACKECFDMASEYVEDITLTGIISESYVTAKDKGFHTTGQTFGDKMMLAVSELAEALEEYRNNRATAEIYFVLDENGNPKPEGIPVEIVDCIIRLCDDAGFYMMPLLSAYRLKSTYNRTRDRLHGGKVM